MQNQWAGVRVFESADPATTEGLGAWLGSLLEAGMVVDLRGVLGAGKTSLVRGLARGLGVEGGVRSPTFTICHVHAGPVPLYHIDATRIEDPAELLWHGWDDLISGGVAAVEWGERVAELFGPARVQVTLEHVAPGRRRVSMAVGDPDLWQRMVRQEGVRPP